MQKILITGVLSLLVLTGFGCQATVGPTPVPNPPNALVIIALRAAVTSAKITVDNDVASGKLTAKEGALGDAAAADATTLINDYAAGQSVTVTQIDTAIAAILDVELTKVARVKAAAATQPVLR